MGNMKIEEVYTLFEEIKELLEDRDKNTTIIQPEIEIPDLSAMNLLVNKLEKTIEEIHKPIKTEHRHIISIASNKVFYGFIGILVSIFICFFVIYNQWGTIHSYKDNDLKYRYIKTQGETTPEILYNLENIFENNRDSAKIISKYIKQYEKSVIEEAKRLEKVRLKE
ncbi:MAG: hypothetical protein LBP67_07795 [Bacteroidales bacterium]|jgi:hypothetical protein|nr:hypothetical protein [Bacteroidales bacterium]